MRLQMGRGAVRLLRVVWTAAVAVAVTAATAVRLVLSAWYYPLIAAVAVAWLGGFSWYLPRLCERFDGTFDGQTVSVSSGIFWRRETHIPLSALRTFEVWDGPLHRLFGCRTVILRFAGGCAVLPLLSRELADGLTDRWEGRT